jgi:hypothetical protein
MGLGIALLIFFVCAFLLPRNPHVSDGQLTKKFEAKRQDLEKLASMAIEDRVTAVYRDVVRQKGDPDFSAVRFDEYQKLFDKNGFLSVSAEKNVVDVCCASISVLDLDGDEKIVSSRGYCFSRDELQPQMTSLDELEPYQWGTYYHKLDANWYLYQEAGISKPE